MIYSITTFAILPAISPSISVASAVIDIAIAQYYVGIHNSMITNALQIIKSLAGDETIDFNFLDNLAVGTPFEGISLLCRL